MSKGIIICTSGVKNLLFYDSFELSTDPSQHGIHLRDGSFVYVMQFANYPVIVKCSDGQQWTVCTIHMTVVHDDWYFKDAFEASVITVGTFTQIFCKDVARMIAKEVWKTRKNSLWK